MLRIGIIPTLAPYLLPVFIGRYKKKYPNIYIKVVEQTTDEIVNLLNKDLIDVGILVTPLKEEKIIERLYALKEVKEVHSVHGEVDILLKIVLTRDLVSSDAEIIGSFVHNRIRQIPGVVSTQTLIPGFSKIKEEGVA